ncbi:Methyltransferase-like protein 6 [Dermatophagoides farinae]|uniref:tRNA N(3)-methylcytidine methyltransferase n=1 Tax=Dermatophagoides farinae TaxID=6954 RepID=A0A922HYL4_DERFA|nr:Methyltransferase-like protein 6 [Dermatophagoides farinae]
MEQSSESSSMKKMEDDKKFGQSARQLTKEEIDKLNSDTELISDFRQRKLEQECKKNWDLFYKRNEDRFFRDRNWTTREFHELLELSAETNDDRQLRLLEVGCGVGNFIWPLLESGLPFQFYACDFSPRAIDLLRKNERYDPKRCHVFQADITEPNGIGRNLSSSSSCDNENLKFDFVALIFVLSSIHPCKMPLALKNISDVLDDDRGILIFRDYGLYDHSMLRYSNGHKLDENFYVRQDGTRTYYFSIDVMNKLAQESDLEVIQLNYIQRETINIKENLCVPRIFLQGKFRKKRKSSYTH